MADNTRACKDCGTTTGMDWWVGRHALKASGRPPTAAARCHDCYNAFHRAKYSMNQARRSRHAETAKAYRSSRQHVKRYSRIAVVPCVDCGTLFTRSRQNWGTRCRPCQSINTITKRNATEARRRAAYSAGDRSIHWSDIGERDGWKCHLCGGTVQQVAGTASNPLGATVDHLVPIAAGGEHVRSNVAVAHRVCNLKRLDKGIAQLRLVG